MHRNKNKKSKLQQKIAGKRIAELFEQARKRYKQNVKLAERYVALARKIAMKYRLSIPSALKRRFCKHCGAYLIPGVNCRIRLHKKRYICYCLNCRKYIRVPYKK